MLWQQPKLPASCAVYHSLWQLTQVSCLLRGGREQGGKSCELELLTPSSRTSNLLSSDLSTSGVNRKPTFFPLSKIPPHHGGPQGPVESISALAQLGPGDSFTGGHPFIRLVSSTQSERGAVRTRAHSLTRRCLGKLATYVPGPGLLCNRKGNIIPSSQD